MPLPILNVIAELPSNSCYDFLVLRAKAAIF